MDGKNNVAEKEEIIASGMSASGDIRNLILSINTTREMLIKCGYKKVIIDASKAVVETMDDERKEIQITEFDDPKQEQREEIEGRFNFN